MDNASRANGSQPLSLLNALDDLSEAWITAAAQHDIAVDSVSNAQRSAPEAMNGLGLIQHQCYTRISINSLHRSTCVTLVRLSHTSKTHESVWLLVTVGRLAHTNQPTTPSPIATAFTRTADVIGDVITDVIQNLSLRCNASTGLKA
jgi:hypothetical protein